MEQYRLEMLILFFKAQQATGFKTINFVLDVIDSDAIPDDKKKNFILKALQEAGLNETSKSKEHFGPAAFEKRVASKRPEKHECFVAQPMEFCLLDGIHEAYIPLN